MNLEGEVWGFFDVVFSKRVKTLYLHLGHLKAGLGRPDWGMVKIVLLVHRLAVGFNQWWMWQSYGGRVSGLIGHLKLKWFSPIPYAPIQLNPVSSS